MEEKDGMADADGCIWKVEERLGRKESEKNRKGGKRGYTRGTAKENKMEGREMRKQKI